MMAASRPKNPGSVQAAALLDHGFANCTAFQENPDDITLPPQEYLRGGITPEIIPRVEKPFQYVLCGDEQSYKPKRKICYRKHLQAPIKEGTIIGSVQYTLNDQEIGSLPIVAAKVSKKPAIANIFLKLLQAIIGKWSHTILRACIHQCPSKIRNPLKKNRNKAANPALFLLPFLIHNRSFHAKLGIATEILTDSSLPS